MPFVLIQNTPIDLSSYCFFLLHSGFKDFIFYVLISIIESLCIPLFMLPFFIIP